MATWAYLNHDRCKLPTLAECEKVGAKTGSVVKCGDSAIGCGRHWLLLLEYGKWVETSPKVDHYVPAERYVPIDGVDQDEFQKRREQTFPAAVRHEAEFSARFVTESQTIERGAAQAILQRERMLDS